MKKLFSVLIAVVMVFCLSVTAFAADTKSPTASPVGHSVVRVNGVGATSTETVKAGETFSIEADSSKGTFNNWSIYKASGAEAVLGTDYEITSGSLTATKLVIKPLADLTVCGNYNNVKTTVSGATGEAVSPKTGDAWFAFSAIMMLAAVCGIVVCKKQLAD